MRGIRYIVLSAALLLSLSGCRRMLWVYTDEYRQVELLTDWSLCEERPGGMTAWFMADDRSGTSRRLTTAEVDRTMLNLPRGKFTGVVVDWSPDEYGGQEFVGMSVPDEALVRVREADPQPAADEDLYGAKSVPVGMGVRRMAGSDRYIVSSVPEPMCADTLKNVRIVTGAEGDLIPWTQKDTYGQTLILQTLESQPRPITWRLRILVYVRGINYMKSVRGSIAGLSEGNRLAELRHSEDPCLHALNQWETRNAMSEVGTIATTIYTFGLPEDAGTKASEALPALRMNLQFLLRDNKTVLNYHYDLGSDVVTIYEDQMVVRIDIPIDYPCPDLPYVDGDGEAGFDAVVTPWEDGGNADIRF
ncbi:MAG: DUF5119 domain-containing protein [Bacteroidales bacterium]|nr:DUF5119 domain-containing protein [Bacteroidales bacterium]